MNKPLHEPLRIGALILAAGEGSRMGGMPKCLIRVNGQTLLFRLQSAMAAMDVAQIVVVTGYHAALVEAGLAALPVTVVRNPEPERGQQSSVRIGLQALGADFDVIVIALADQPGIGSEELSELLSAFRQRPAGTCIVLPMVDGQRGNPVAVSGELIAQWLAAELEGGLRAYIDAHPEWVYRMATGNSNFTLDLDTREDVERVSGRLGLNLELPAVPGLAPG